MQGEKSEKKDDIPEDDRDRDPKRRTVRDRGNEEKSYVSADQENFISERIKHLSQGRALFEKARKDAVQRIGKGGECKDRQGDETKALLCRSVGNKGDKKDGGEKDPEKGQVVRNAQALTVSVVSVEAAS